MVEVVVGVVLLGLLGALGLFKLSNLQKMKRLDEEGRALFSAVAHARSLALKKDLVCLLKFDLAANSYGVFEDRNGNGIAEASERIALRALPFQIAFGSPRGGPAAGPGGTGVPALKAEGGWRTQMSLRNDRSAGMNDGSLYLQNTALDRRTICLRKRAASLQLELWSWDGKRWNAL